MAAESAARVFHPSPTRQPSLIATIGLQPGAGQSVIQFVKSGLPFEVFDRLRSRLELSQSELARLAAIPVTTLKRREIQGRFTTLEGDRLLRIATVLERCDSLFEGDSRQALRWLKSPAQALAGTTPLAYLETEAGAHEVLNLIGRLEHGIVS